MKTSLYRLSSVLFVLTALISTSGLSAQTSTAKKKHVIIDVAHGQKFWHDPADMAGMDTAFVSRIKYMTREITRNAQASNADIGYQKTPITSAALKNCDVLFIHIPSKKFEAGEVEAIKKYLENGGGLFIVIEEDAWAKLEQVNANDIVSPYGIVFKSDNPDKKNSGGHSKEGVVTKKALSIPFHGARLVEGGTPFCFSNQSDENPFGVYKEVKGGGKIIAMGEGMVSLYMTSWEGVNDYQCSAFMNDAFAWLLK